MFDVFTEEIEVLIKDGIANLYWYKGDLHKAWVRSGVPPHLQSSIASLKDGEGHDLTKRKQMDLLYEQLRNFEYNRRLEISRNFVRVLIGHQRFTPQNEKHRIEVAERAALKLKEIISIQVRDREQRESLKRKSAATALQSYELKLHALYLDFQACHNLSPQKKGYALEKLFTELMRISGIPVQEPFKITGEQFDGAIKYEGHHYLIELKYTEEKTDPKEIGHFYYKVDGKFEAKGFFISMNGFTTGVLESLPRGKELKVLLLDGIHLTNVLHGHYRFQQLLDHAIANASLRGNIYCSHNIT